MLKHKNENDIARGKYRVLSLHMSVRVHPAYKLCASQSSQSSKPNAFILGRVMALKPQDATG